MDPWYVTGLVETAGSFTYSRQSGSSIAIYFAIKLPQREEPLLRDLQRYFRGIGRIYAAGSTARYFRVTRHGELPTILAHFDRHPLRSQKQKAYNIWRRMAELKLEHHRRTPPARLEELARELTDTT
jgi:hypothetical protein